MDSSTSMILMALRTLSFEDNKCEWRRLVQYCKQIEVSQNVEDAELQDNG